MTARTFTAVPAVRESVPLLVGLTGPSGGGKTFSALRLATGIQTVTGGNIYAIDTEARRMLHYADRFRRQDGTPGFKHLQFDAPFGSLDYLAAIRHCMTEGAKVIIVDSMSHEHEGPGGLLDLHDSEAARLAKAWKTSLDKVNMAAWQLPKYDRRELIAAILQMRVNFIFCFRAKEKIKMAGGKPIPQGFMPIAGEEFVFEMTVNCLLLPHADGVPTWQSDEPGERMMMKLPEQFRTVFADRKPLSEDIGHELAAWAAGGEKPTTIDADATVLASARNAAKNGKAVLQAHWKTLSQPARRIVKPIMDELTMTATEADAMVQEPVTEDVIYRHVGQEVPR
jgi:hypothetical protein